MHSLIGGALFLFLGGEKMEKIKIINKNVVEKIITDLQKIPKNEHIEEILIEEIQNSPKRTIEKYMDTLSTDEKIDLYALMFFGREILENDEEESLKMFVKNRKHAEDLIEQKGFYGNYLTGNSKLLLYLNKSLIIYKILDNKNSFIF